MFLTYITLFSGFILLVFSSVLILKEKHVRKDNKVLGVLFFIMAVYGAILPLYQVTLHGKGYAFLAYVIPFDYVLLTLIGPFIYFYVKTLLNMHVNTRSWKFWIHFITAVPALNCYIYSLFVPMAERENLLLLSLKDGFLVFIVLDLIFYIQMTLYLFVCYRTINNHLKISSKVTKGTTMIDISWLKTLLVIDLVFMFVTAPLCFYFANVHTSNVIAQLAISLQLVYIFIKSIWQTGIFPGEVVCEIKTKEPLLKIANEVGDDYCRTLQEYMLEKRPYLQENCSIQSVAEQTGIPLHHLSNILNQRFAKNFPDFINEYRINEAMRILDSKQSEKMTLESIGYECGFGSKSSFNKAFKKLTDSTPSAYRQKSKS